MSDPIEAPALLAAPRVLGPVRARLGEGLFWSTRERALWWVDILAQRLYRQTLDAAPPRHWDFDSTVSAVAERAHAPGLALLLRRGLALFDPETGRLQTGAEPEPERTGNRFNDGKCDGRGRFWGGTMDFAAVAPTGALYCFGLGDRVERAADLGWVVTNGPTWTLDQRRLLLNDTDARRILAYPFDLDRGQLGSPREWLRFRPEDGHPDGITTDAFGRIWIAHWGGGCVSCHDPDSAEELLRIALPTDHITNVCFGGPGLRTLIVSSAREGLSPAQLDAQPLAGALFAVETDAVGLPPQRYAG